ncbi:DUF904 domain-containing protein [Thalassomonas sp. M1454]|uniref:DUF904 domain-containing protein n=1 Tax=Thalassomonas sp. M1454 TaxID=2594477 RepID=UPI00117C3A00|nr:DUF904 domain-containing protein [Thalassomonas sp. M1454]TRX57265.1 DUF904 domain-containing protein [Thalassomonas sp. M1454]
MLDTALAKLTELTEQLVEKNSLIQAENMKLKTQYEELESSTANLKEDNESLQLEALEQEEKQADVLNKVNALLNRLQPAE